ncbi:MAG TPA: alpha/beta hydrolase [Cellulomonas sp.]
MASIDAAVPDVLGDGWVRQTLRLRPDARGAAVATLVHRTEPDAGRTAVLYLHGLNDYFFHPHVADALVAGAGGRGYELYGLDLRDHGRSIRPGREPNDTRALAAYAEEIDAAVQVLHLRHDRVVLLGHSTGGLTAALWADARRGTGLVDAVVLNSPWLDLRAPWLTRTVLTPVLDVLGRVAPSLPVARLAPYYGQALHVGSGGEWDYDLAWKPHDGFAVRAGLVRAVRRGQARVARGLAIDVPVLVATSDATGPDDRWHDRLLTSDSVLDVADMRRLAPRLGPDVTLVEIAGGAHDLALSPAPARAVYLSAVTGWLDRRLAAQGEHEEHGEPAGAPTA